MPDPALDRAAARVDDADADTVPDTLDIDDDNDGVLDALELDADGADRDTDSDGMPDRLDLDSDNDSLPDWQESGAVFAVDVSGLGLDGARLVGEVGANGLLDALERGADTGVPRFDLANSDRAAETARGALPDMLDLDSDNDGVPDLVEAGVAPMHDADGDARIDAPPGTVGADGIADRLQVVNDRSCCDVTGDGREDPLPPNSDAAGLPDPLDADSDDDGVADLLEAGGTDVDGDGRVDDFLDLDGGPDGPEGDAPGSGGPDGLDDAYALVPLVDTDVNGNGLVDRLDPDAVGSPDPDDESVSGTGAAGPGAGSSAGEPVASVAPEPARDVTVTYADDEPASDAVVLTGLDASGCSVATGAAGVAGDALLVALALGAATALGARARRSVAPVRAVPVRGRRPDRG